MLNEKIESGYSEMAAKQPIEIIVICILDWNLFWTGALNGLNQLPLDKMYLSNFESRSNSCMLHIFYWKFLLTKQKSVPASKELLGGHFLAPGNEVIGLKLNLEN